MTRITELPKRGELISLNGNGTDVSFEFKGKGTVNFQLKCAPSAFNVSGGTNQFTFTTPSTVGLHFLDDRQYATTTVDATCP